MKNVLLIILITLSTNLIFSQPDFSMHSINFFKNEKQKNIKVLEIWVVVNGTKIQGEKFGASFRFPIIDSTTTFDLVIVTNRMQFESDGYNAWILNKGSSITLGKITRINKLISVAEYNEMDKSEVDFDTFAKRFFIADGNYTIDINNYQRVKRLDYLIINPNQQGDGSYVLTHKNVKVKK